jgi:hypothetical protein
MADQDPMSQSSTTKASDPDECEHVYEGPSLQTTPGPIRQTRTA